MHAELFTTFSPLNTRRKSWHDLLRFLPDQWADLPFETICQKAKRFGFDGLELACWGDHFDVRQGAKIKGVLRYAP